MCFGVFFDRALFVLWCLRSACVLSCWLFPSTLPSSSIPFRWRVTVLLFGLFCGEFLAMPVRSVNWVKLEICEIEGCFLAMDASKSGVGEEFFKDFD